MSLGLKQKLRKQEPFHPPTITIQAGYQFRWVAYSMFGPKSLYCHIISAEQFMQVLQVLA